MYLAERMVDFIGQDRMVRIPDEPVVTAPDDQSDVVPTASVTVGAFLANPV